MTKERFLSGDRAILVLLVFNIILFTSIFLYDYTQYGYTGNQKVIGTILSKSKTIQRKFDSEVVWKDIEIGNSIQNRDTILTAEGSQAKLKLLDGTEILIAENSMIFIDYLDNRANLEISVGGLQVTRRPENKDNPSSVGIRSGDGVLKLVEGIVNVEKKKNQKNLEYAVLSGSIKADPSNPVLLYPKKSLEGFEKLFPVAASVQTTESIQSASASASSSSGNTGSSNSSLNNSSGTPLSSGSSSNSNSSSSNYSDPTSDPNYGKYDNGNPNYRNSTGSNANSNNTNNSGNPAGSGQTGLNTKSGLKLEKTASGNSQTENKNQNGNSQNNGSGPSRTGYDPGEYLGKQKYEQNKIQEKSDPSAPKNKTETSNSESKSDSNKSGSSTNQEVKKPKPPRELTPEEIQRQEKEKRRREREDKEQREFLRM
ncbi:FecR family protein [Leptospira adleri]|uniref:Iron dicitrate transport regulator FecR n=1 Tax=Leptospira adleri TaxID=2023186 RepID=A0A2M9YIK0_9LEPT|nr:FecR family protein [Leptospira adleri]PJZ51363.1 iron dicitrate transport regulator FecR [Leptospira adleri]PJZ60112.1 iron dicitrate transport regulator FecR [Leptospira adleri]